MTIKAAVYRAKSYTDTQPLRISFGSVVQLAASVGYTWHDRNLHNVAEWSQLLVTTRAVSPTSSPLDPLTAAEVRQRAAAVAVMWHPTIRYHANVAYRYEALRMQDHATWFVERFESL